MLWLTFFMDTKKLIFADDKSREDSTYSAVGLLTSINFRHQ